MASTVSRSRSRELGALSVATRCATPWLGDEGRGSQRGRRGCSGGGRVFSPRRHGGGGGGRSVRGTRTEVSRRPGSFYGSLPRFCRSPRGEGGAAAPPLRL